MKTRLSLLIAVAEIFCLSTTAQTRHSKFPTSPIRAKQYADSMKVGRKKFSDIITQERMNKGLVSNPLDALNGRAAGVNINSDGADRMAMLSSVRVRGTTSLTGGNDPLVIIDGVYSDLSSLYSIFPADIESFTILKNASETAPYGSRGASGVIVVTTKKGADNHFHISYDANLGIESVYKTLPMLSAAQYRSEAAKRGLTITDGNQDTDFQRAITRTGFIQYHHLAFSGGSENSNYRASIARMDHNSIIRRNNSDNFAAKVDLMQRAFDGLLKIDMGLLGSSMHKNNIYDVQKLCYSAAAQNPTLHFHPRPSGGWERNTQATQINPPDAHLQAQDQDKILNFTTHLRLTAHISKDVSLKAFGSYSHNSSSNSQYLPTWLAAQGQAYRAETKCEEWLGNLETHWNHTYGAHKLDALFLLEVQKREQTNFFTTVKGITSSDFGFDNLSAGSLRPYGGTGSSYENANMLSFMTQAEYNYLDLFTLRGNIRADGSSMFGTGNKWGFFPSISASWDVLNTFPQISSEAFNTMKLRSGFGLSGNTGSIRAYNSLLLLNPIGLISWKGTPITTFGIVSNANPDLKWETRSSFNLGADLGFWRNRVVLTAEYYYSRTHNMLYMYDVPVPPFVYPKMLANLGSMSNSGFELGLGVTPLQRRDMELNINVNVSFQKNKLISLSGNCRGRHLSASAITPIGGLNGAGFHGGDNNIVYQIIGQPLGVFYLPHCKGLIKKADGSYAYDIADLDHNGTVDLSDNGDRYIAGQATPKVTLGSNISFRYKDFDVALQMNGAFGHKIYNGSALTYMNMTSFPYYNVMTEAPKANITDQVASDYWLERGDYLNFDYLTVGWNLPIRKWSRYISALRVSLSVNNIATISAYKGLTPMINRYAVNSTIGVDDKRSLPLYRTYSFGFSIQF